MSKIEDLTKIKVLDCIMGSGKTSYAIQMMNENPDKKFIYVSPFLDELDRVMKACPELDFIEPERKGYETKSDDLKKILIAGMNICTTHELFRRLDKEALELIKSVGYVLIMDEIMEVITMLEDVNKSEFKDMIASKAFKLEDTDNPKIQKVKIDELKNLRKYNQYYKWAENDRLIFFEDKILLWLFPPKIFDSFDEVWNLCYLFSGSQQKAYYDLYNLDFEYRSVKKVNDRYELDDYSDTADVDVRLALGELIEIYEGQLNNIGRPTKKNEQPLSYSWYYRNRGNGKLKILNNNLYNYYRHVLNSNSSKFLWTTFKPNRTDIKAKGYAKSFLSKSIRSTNKYRDKADLAYCVNIFMKPEIIKYYKHQGVFINEEMYALSEMIQWIWRSRIRNFESSIKDRKINVFIPSERMRNLLVAWLNGKLPLS